MAIDIEVTADGLIVTLVPGTPTGGGGGATGNAIYMAETPEEARQAMALGTAATLNAGTNPGDALTVGTYGIADAVTAQNGTDLDTLRTFGLYLITDPIHAPEDSGGSWFVRVEAWDSGSGTDPLRIVQHADGYGVLGSMRNRTFIRTYFSANSVTQWSDWVEK